MFGMKRGEPFFKNKDLIADAAQLAAEEAERAGQTGEADEAEPVEPEKGFVVHRCGCESHGKTDKPN